MTSLQELYGDKYKEVMYNDKQKNSATRLISDISGLNIIDIKYEFGSLFDSKTHRLRNDWVKYIKERVEKMQPLYILDEIEDYSSVPVIIRNEEYISYFRLIDIKTKSIYILYITPTTLNSF